MASTTTTDIGIFAIDPGTTSACARGVYAWNESVWEGLADGHCESWEVEGSPGVQAWEIMGEYLDWSHEVAPVRTALVFEDFVVNLGPGAASKRELLDPVRVTSACDALCWTRSGLRWAHPELQQPSDKAFATNARLRDHGLWVVGSDHRRDAVRHLVKRYSRHVKENTRTT